MHCTRKAFVTLSGLGGLGLLSVPYFLGRIAVGASWDGMASIWTEDHPWNEEKPMIRSIQGYLNWVDIQPDSPDRFEWGALNRLMERAETLRKPIMLQINGMLPAWISERVPYLNFESRLIRVHQFWHPDYVSLHQRLIRAFAAHLASHPKREWIIGVRLQPNAFNTEAWHWEFNKNEPWQQALRQLADKKVPAPEQPDHPSNWVVPKGVTVYEPLLQRGDLAVGQAYLKTIAETYKAAFHPQGIRTFCRIEWCQHEALDAWLDTHYWNDPMAGILETSFGVWQAGSYSLAKVKQLTEQFRLPVYCEDVKGTDVRKNAASREREIYWRTLLKLHGNVTINATYMGDLDMTGTPAWDESFALFNRYAGCRRRPEPLPGAFLVFARFPSRSEGEGEAIRNIGYGLEQVDPAATTSVSNVGEATAHYGHQAEVLQADALRLRLDKAIADAVRGRPLDVRVSWFDEDGADWNLLVHDGQAPTPAGSGLLETVSGNWKTRRFTLASCAIPGGTSDDLAVVRTGHRAPILHKIELTPAAG